AEDGIRDFHVTGVQTCALPILRARLQRQLQRLVVHAKGECHVLSLVGGSRGLLARKVGAARSKQKQGNGRDEVALGHLALSGYRSEERRVGKGGRCDVGPIGLW